MSAEPAGWETDVFGEALACAPSVLNTQPWSLRTRPGVVELTERDDVVLPFHDPSGRDRTISCGAAVVNLDLALRAVGRSAALTVLPEPGDRTVIARFQLLGRAEPSRSERTEHAAMTRRASHRRPFAPRQVSEDTISPLMALATREGAHAHLVTGLDDIGIVAELMEQAGRVFQRDEGYQRELALWTVRDEQPHRRGVGVARSSDAPGALASAGMVSPLTEVPDRRTLTERLARERVLVFVTEGDTTADHVRAGMAMQRTWLGTVMARLAGAVQTQPLQLPRVREAFARRLQLGGHVQVLMRIGYPAHPARSRPRRSVHDVLR